MTKSNEIKKELTVKWIVKDKRVIKFLEEDDNTYRLAENVLEYLDDIKSNVAVDVTINDNQVTYIAKKTASKKKVEKKETKSTEEPVDSSQESKKCEVVTVKGISKTRDYYLFDEYGEKEWFTIASNVKNFLKDVSNGDKLEISYEVSNEGKRTIRTVTFAKIIEKNQIQSKSESKNNFTNKSSYRDEGATDKRTASMNAKEVVVALINNKLIEKANIKDAIIDLTELFYNTTQNLE